MKLTYEISIYPEQQGTFDPRANPDEARRTVWIAIEHTSHQSEHGTTQSEALYNLLRALADKF